MVSRPRPPAPPVLGRLLALLRACAFGASRPCFAFAGYPRPRSLRHGFATFGGSPFALLRAAPTLSHGASERPSSLGAHFAGGFAGGSILAPFALRAKRSARPRGRGSDGAAASPRPRACLSAFGGLRSVGRRCAPFGVPARAVGAPLRFAPARSALRAYGNASACRGCSALRSPASSALSRSVRPRSLDFYTNKSGASGARCSALGASLARPSGACLPLKAFALARPSPSLARPSGASTAFPLWLSPSPSGGSAGRGCRTALRA